MSLLLPIGAAAGTLGLLLGSFFNVVIWRVPRRLSVVHPRSECPGCGSAIRGWDNIPVLSWMLLRGRCRDCGIRISAQYPAVEALTATAFAAVAVAFGASAVYGPWNRAAVASLIEIVALLVLTSASIILSVIDLQSLTIPDRILVPTGAAIVLLLLAAGLVAQDAGAVLRLLIGGAGLALFYFVVWFIRPDAMGFGDVKLSAIIGAALGYFGWSQFAVGAFSAFVLGGLTGLVLLISRRTGRSTKLPFGPWMFVGAWIGVGVGTPISVAYLSLVGIT